MEMYNIRMDSSYTWEGSSMGELGENNRRRLSIIKVHRSLQCCNIMALLDVQTRESLFVCYF